ncbi:MAG: hypothetical protein GF350_03210 [Chitinivibrionales bacterium]|nr:hypothetical protein [Chitinivibrionales bacterium]
MKPAEHRGTTRPGNIHDKYELLEYYLGKLDSRTSRGEMYEFLLEFLVSIIGENDTASRGCVFIVNEQTLLFEPIVCSDVSVKETCRKEHDQQVDNGIIPWCIQNKRPVFAESFHRRHGKHCIILPLYTASRMLGLVFLYTDKAESDISRAMFKIISLACLQTSLYADMRDINAQLRAAQAQLVQSEKLAGIGQLAAGIAHEINNPVGFVTSNSSTLQSYVSRMKQMLEFYRTHHHTPETARREKELKIDRVLDDIDALLDENSEGLSKIAEIVRSIKSFARSDQDTEFAKSDINEGLRGSLVIARNEIKYHADVETRLGDIPPVHCAIGALNQVFLNILVNAAQAIKESSKNGKGRICLRTCCAGNRVIVEIQDNGPGIPDDILPKIFDPFFTTKPDGSGTGLGLSISHDIIVKKHGGRIDVRTTEGEGTLFRISLPVD